MQRRVVVLPAPVGPSSTKNSRSPMSSLSSLHARCGAPNRLADALRARLRPCLSGRRAAMRPLRLSKKCVRVSSRRAHTASPCASHEAARRARAQDLLAELEVDDVVGAQRLDDVRLAGDVAAARLQRDAALASGRTPRASSSPALALLAASRAASPGNAKASSSSPQQHRTCAVGLPRPRNRRRS